ncbi:tyrosine-type recombinase/integrase [Vagococcus vulneris]|uniref:Recombinase n=1 Tax=Vagococcus vulneris TaxID=1977869 RepID=A0A430A1A8_9ENTE|nr:tyrosine-type recombinase/integrase [Vagococcus vulneris]RSU00119.1 hypothetical protein CBF37_02130 [Vagococcus vulneris]
MFIEISLAELLAEMELNDRSRGLTCRTIAKNNKVLRMFFTYLDEHFGITKVSEVKPVHIKQFMVFKNDSGAAESYVNVFLRCIRALFSFAVDEEYILEKNNPVTKVKWMKEQKKQVRAWSDNDVIKMVNHTQSKTKETKKKVTKSRGHMSWFVAERNRLMILLLADTGIRVGELTNLRETDITDRAVYINRGKGKKDRSVYCSPLVAKQKIKYDRAKKIYFSNKNTALKNDYIFVSKTGDKLSVDMAERFVTQIGSDAGCDPSIRMSPHTFRHYFTQKQLDLGANIYDLQILLGHTSIKTTETYLKSISSDTVLERGMEKSPLMNLNKK